jgi:hypothetical protein
MGRKHGKLDLCGVWVNAWNGTRTSKPCEKRHAFIQFTTESLVVLYSRSPALQSLFMRKAQYTKTSLLEGRRSPVNPSVVRLFFLNILIHLAEHLTIELDIVLSSADGHAGRQTESATLLTITVSANARSSLIATVTTANSATSDRDNSALEDQAEMLSAALGRAEDAINTMETWSSAVDVIKRVMDAVSPIAAVCPYIVCLFITKLTSAP